MSDSPSEIRLGVIGSGSFGLFALQHFVQVPGVRFVGMAGTDRPAAHRTVKRFGIENIEDVDVMLHRDDIDLVYIATPPFLHYPQAMAALRAGKHVICEKPLALRVEEADEMLAFAAERDLLVVTNLMQRYNPLFTAVAQLIQQQILGSVLHGYFENYAADEGLSREHWFWDPARSGGIFVEHGVHFFDLFTAWLGDGTVLSASATQRPANGVEEQVECTVRFGETALVHFYHGFHQIGRLDRQELRLVFERGDLTLYGWVPLQYRIFAAVDEGQTKALCRLFPNYQLRVNEVLRHDQRISSGRHQTYDIDQIIEVRGEMDRPKMHLYGDLLQGMLADQIAWIRDRSHPRRLEPQHGRESLALAVAAAKLSGGRHARVPGDLSLPNA